MTHPRSINTQIIFGVLGLVLLTGCSQKSQIELLNASYDPTRELYAEFNRAFVSHWKESTGEEVKINTAHAGSGAQSRTIRDGGEADVATLALAYDLDALSEKTPNSQEQPLIPGNWQSRLPHNSAPYTSTIVFLVRKGNPKHIKDWDDLARVDVSVITPNPKTGGGARWNYLAAWAYANRKFSGDEQGIRSLIGKIYGNAVKNGLPSGARSATITFTERKMGDVCISWENEALLLKKKSGDEYEIVTPSLSILAEPPVTVVDANVDRHNTRRQATAYLEYLYSPEGQEIIAKNFYRPVDQSLKAKFPDLFKDLDLVTIADFGGWRAAQQTHFADGGTFDQILRNLRK
jgi:sulfate transport system substrate-binding protein